MSIGLLCTFVFFGLLVGKPVLGSGSWIVDSYEQWHAGVSMMNLNPYLATGTSFLGAIAVRRSYNDEFDWCPGTSPAYWRYEWGNGSVDETNCSGTLRLTGFYTGFTDWYGCNNTAIRTYQPIDGDFIAEVKVATNFILHNWAKAGMFVMLNPNTRFTCGVLTANGGHYYDSYHETDCATTSPVSVSGNNWGYFRIQRTGNLLKGFYSTDGTNWNQLGTLTADWGQMAIGMYCYSTSWSSAYADFDYFHISTTRSTRDRGYYASKVIDLTAIPSAAGTISWEKVTPADSSIEMRTRTSTDGSLWSTWSSPYAVAAGSAISSPSGRYIQFSATLWESSAIETPRLDKVTITYPGIPPPAPIVTSVGYKDEGWGNAEPVALFWGMPAGNPVSVTAYAYTLDRPLLACGGTCYITDTEEDAIRVSATVTGVQYAGLDDGIHHFRIAAQGEALEYVVGGQTTFTIRKDTVPPDTAVITSPTHPANEESENNSPQFVISASDSMSATIMVSGVAGYRYALDANYGTQPSASATFSQNGLVSFSGLANGSWWLHARAVDVAGNMGQAGHYPVRVKFTGLPLEESRVHAVPHPIRGNSAVIRYDLASPAMTVTFEFLDSVGRSLGKLAGTAAAGRNEVTWDTTALANGIYYAKIKVRRRDGKEDTVIKKLAIVR